MYIALALLLVGLVESWRTKPRGADASMEAMLLEVTGSLKEVSMTFSESPLPTPSIQGLPFLKSIS